MLAKSMQKHAGRAKEKVSRALTIQFPIYMHTHKIGATIAHSSLTISRACDVQIACPRPLQHAKLLSRGRVPALFPAALLSVPN